MIKELLFLLNFLVAPNVELDSYALKIAYDIRQVTDAKLLITSNCRDRKGNKAVGGKWNSKHLKCRALDIRIYGLKYETIEAIKELGVDNTYDVVVEYKPPHIHIELN